MTGNWGKRGVEGAAPKAFPRGEGGFQIANTLAIWKTDEECGRKSPKFALAARPAKRGVEGAAPYSGILS